MKPFLFVQENSGAILFRKKNWIIKDANQYACQRFALPKQKLLSKRLPELVNIPAEILTQINNTQILPHETVIETLFFLPDHSNVMGMIVRHSATLFYFLFFSMEKIREHLFLPQLRYFIKNIRFSGMFLDRSGNLQYVSQMFCKTTRYRANEIIGKNFFTLFFTEKDALEKQNQYRQVLENGLLPQTLQFPLMRKDGRIIQMLWNLNFLLDDRKEKIGISGLGVDIAYLSVESRKTKRGERLETVIAKIASMFAQAPTYKVDESINKTLQMVGEYANVDRSYLFLFRNNQQIMVNTHEWCADGIAPQIDNLQNVPSKIFPWWMKRLLKHEIIHIPKVTELPPEASAEKEILQAQDIQSLIVVPMIENDELIGFIGFDSVRMPKYWETEDINLLKIISSIFVSSLKRKSTELSLADSERKYRTLFRTAPDLIFILNSEGLIEALNPAFTVITKQNIDDWIGRPFSDLIIAEERKSFKSRFKDCLNGKYQQPHEIRIMAPDGFKIVETICSPFSSGGKKRGVYGIARDLTDRKILEENLRHAERMKSIGLLAGGIAHDFNNILGIIQGNYTIIKENLPTDAQIRDPLEAIRQAVERGKTLIQNLLTFARKKEPKYEVLDLNREIEKVVNLLRQTTPKAVTYQLHLSKKVLPVLSDQIQIHQLLLNLCLNAIDAIRATGKTGKIEIKTDLVSAEKLPIPYEQQIQPSYIHLSVQDNGIGMEESELKFIFDPFYSTKEGGTGLGLSVVFGVVRGMNGYIEVESKKDRGTTFHLFFPASPKKVTLKRWQKKADSRFLFGSARILLVEDDILLSQMLSHLLKTHGYGITSVYSGDKAIEMFEKLKKEIDLVILDFDLPEKDGYAVAQEIKQINPQVKIILTTGFIEPEIKQKIEKLNDILFFEKPYDPENILEVIPKILNIN